MDRLTFGLRPRSARQGKTHAARRRKSAWVRDHERRRRSCRHARCTTKVVPRKARGPVNLLRTLLAAAVETGVLETMPELPKPPPPGRKLPSAPSTEEVEAMLGKPKGSLQVAIAPAAFAGLRQGEVRAALEVRDVDLNAGVITVRHGNRWETKKAPVAEFRD
jgi:integrase